MTGLTDYNKNKNYTIMKNYTCYQEEWLKVYENAPSVFETLADIMKDFNISITLIDGQDDPF